MFREEGADRRPTQVYRAAADGLTIGACSPGACSPSAVLGEPGVEYDPYKFIYLGSPFSENQSDRVRLSILVNLAVAGCELSQLTLQPRSQISVATELFDRLSTFLNHSARIFTATGRISH